MEIRSKLIEIKGRNKLFTTKIPESGNEVISCIKDMKKARVIGIDCEFNAPQDVALVQISTQQYIYLFSEKYLLRFKNEFANFFEKPFIVKCGVNAFDDFRSISKKMRKKILVTSVVDYRFYPKLDELTSGSPSLKNLSKLFLNMSIPKKSPGHWNGGEEMSTKHITYASKDVIASRELYFELRKRKIIA